MPLVPTLATLLPADITNDVPLRTFRSVRYLKKEKETKEIMLTNQ